MTSMFKKERSKIRIINRYRDVLTVEKGTRGGICQARHRYAKANNKCMNCYNKCPELIYLMYLDANNLYGWAMSQKLPVNGFKWENNITIFNEDFIKNYDENSNVGYFLEVDMKYPKNLLLPHKDFETKIFTSQKNRKSRKTCLYVRRQGKICNTYKTFKASIK